MLRLSMLDSIGVHICELLKIDDTPSSSKPTQRALKNWLLLWSCKIHAGHIFNHTCAGGFLICGVSMLDSMGIHICELVKLGDAPNSKPTQQALKNSLLLWSCKIHAGHIFNRTWAEGFLICWVPYIPNQKVEHVRLHWRPYLWIG